MFHYRKSQRSKLKSRASPKQSRTLLNPTMWTCFKLNTPPVKHFVIGQPLLVNSALRSTYVLKIWLCCLSSLQVWLLEISLGLGATFSHPHKMKGNYLLMYHGVISSCCYANKESDFQNKISSIIFRSPIKIVQKMDSSSWNSSSVAWADFFSLCTSSEL